MGYKLDVKNRKILLELSRDCRMSTKSLARKVRLSRDVVKYRIQKLLKEGIIENFLCEIDIERLGYNRNYIFIVLEKFGRERFDSIIKSFIDHPSIMIVTSCAGKYDIMLEVVSKCPDDLNRVLNGINIICGKNLSDYEILTTVDEFKLLHNYILPELSQQDLVGAEKNLDKVLLDEKDFLILTSLEEDSSKPIHVVSKETGIHRDTVSYRIKKLLSDGVIKSCRASINPKPSGYEWHIVTLKFENFTPDVEGKLKSFMLANGEIIYAVKSVGKWHYHMEVIVKNQQHFEEFMMKLRTDFKDDLHRPEALIIFKEYKYTNLPKVITAPKEYKTHIQVEEVKT